MKRKSTKKEKEKEKTEVKPSKNKTKVKRRDKKTMATLTQFEQELKDFGIYTEDIENIQLLTSVDHFGHTSFRGDDLDVLFGMLYVLQKYKGGCTPMHLEISSKNTLTENLGVNWTCVEGKRKLTFPVNFNENFKKCDEDPNVKFIFIFLTFENEKPCRKYDNYAHANLIIYSKSKKLFERFEPNGCSVDFSVWFESQSFDLEFGKYIKKHFPGRGYHTPITCCPYIGIQMIQENEKRGMMNVPVGPGGYCAVFSLWIIALRLRNPDEDFQILQYKAIKKIQKGNKEFTTFINNFAEYIVRKREELIKKLPINIGKYINKQRDILHKLPVDVLRIINKFIKEEFKLI